MTAKESPGAATNSATGTTWKAYSTANIAPSRAARKPATKRTRLLLALLDGPKNSHELEQHPTYDHCPNSTVSELKKAGIPIDAELIEVRGYAGVPTRIARYSLSDAGRAAAHKFLQDCAR